MSSDPTRRWKRRREDLEAELRSWREAAERLGAVLGLVPDALVVLDANRRVVAATPALSTLTGRPLPEVIGLTIVDLLPTLPEDALPVEPSVAHRPGTPTLRWVRLRRVDGARREVEVAVARAPSGPAGPGWIVRLRDATDQVRLEHQLRWQAFRDPLTGLASRAVLVERLGPAVATAARRGGMAGLVFVELDDVERLVDELEPGDVDALLAMAGLRLRLATRGADTPARLGTGRFAVLVEDVPSQIELFALATRVAEAFAAPFGLGGGEITVPASIGVTAIGPGDIPAGGARDPDLARFQERAWGSGPGFLRVAGASPRRSEPDGLGELRDALQRGDLEVRYRPVIDVATARLQEIEVVPLRPGELVAADGDTLLAEADAAGLAGPLGRHVLLRACRDAACWSSPWPTRLVVPVSALHLRQPAAVLDVVEAVQTAGLPAPALTLSLDEASLASPHRELELALGSVRSLGVRLGVRAAGTGPGSQQHLARFHLNRLALDASLVRAVDQSVVPRRLAAALLEMARGAGLVTAASGVSRAEEVAMLRVLGCQLVSGSYVGAPQSSTAIAHRLAGA